MTLKKDDKTTVKKENLKIKVVQKPQKATVPGQRGCLATNRILGRKFQKTHIQPI